MRKQYSLLRESGVALVQKYDDIGTEHIFKYLPGI
jgi:hypothetical protein